MNNTSFSLASAGPSFGGGRVGPAHFGGSLGLLESTPHNVMHPTIGGPTIGQCAGGMMTDPACAALDPIFWLHHANIDRLWNRWLALGGGRANPTQAAWLNQSFVFRDENGVSVTLTGAEVVNSATQLGYVYDDAPTPDAVALSAVSMSDDTPTPAPEPGPPEMVSGTEEPLVLAGDTQSVTLTTPPGPPSDAVSDAATDDKKRLFVTVDDITADQDPGLAYAVYVSGPSGERQHVGNVSLFGIEAMNDPNRRHNGAPGFQHVFEITDAVNQLRSAGTFDPSQVTVTFEPIRIQPPPGEQLPADAQDTGAVPPVRIGRVALHIQ
jgi:tyrosinase